MLTKKTLNFPRIFCLAALSVVGLMSLAVPAQAGPIQYVQNGSFETLTTGNSITVGSGGYFCQVGTTCTSNVANWSSVCRSNSCGTGNTPDSLLSNASGSAFNGNIGLYSSALSPDGGNYVAFDGDTNFNASISQTITGLTAGNSYALTFYQAAAQQKGTTGPTTEQWQINFGSHQYNSTLMTNLSQGFVPWTKQTLTIVADATNVTLSFLSVGTPSGQPPVVMLDGISLIATPEPQTFLMVGVGMVAIPLIAQRRRRRKMAAAQ